MLDYIHRTKAVAEWAKLASGDEIPLERSLGAFDMFVLHSEYGDMTEISALFDDLTAQIRHEYPNLEELSDRQKAISTVQFLRRQDLTGISSEIAYHDLQNNFIGIALQDEGHPSLPLISVAIFCILAKRLRLDARPCGFPSHVHALVYPMSGYTLDGTPSTEATEPMYLDPFRSDVEVPVQDLRRQLNAWGLGDADPDQYLAATASSQIVLRTSRNILATVQEFRNSALGNNGHPTVRLHANPFTDMDNAFYAALWANYMLCSAEESNRGNHRQQFIPMLLEKFERFFPMDVSLIEQYVSDPLRDVPTAGNLQIFETIRAVRIGDAMPKQIQTRPRDPAEDTVKYKVGQVFRHRRYDYLAVITGWDSECGMGDYWMVQNRVDNLSGGRHQSFYHAL